MPREQHLESIGGWLPLAVADEPRVAEQEVERRPRDRPLPATRLEAPVLAPTAGVADDLLTVGEVEV